MSFIKDTNQNLLHILEQAECPDASYKPKEHPLILESAQGSIIFDIEGRRYIDLIAGFGSLPLGHAHPSLLKVLQSPSPIVQGLGDVYPSSAKVKLLQLLQTLAPKPLSRVGLCLGGAQAVEYALKTAFLASGKFGVLSFQGAYHGVDLGILPLSSRLDFRKPFMNWTQEDSVERVCFNGSRDELYFGLKNLQKRGIEAGALILEVIQGRNGVQLADKNWLMMVREFCRKEKILFIVDEIFTGFGRAGELFLSQDLEPDIICLGKALGGGFPLSACLGTESVMQSWPHNQGEAIHTGTFFGHPLSCAVAATTLDTLLKENLIERSKNLGAKVLSYLKTKLQNHRLIKDIRGQGLMIAIEFHKSGYGGFLMDALRPKGLLILPSGSEGSCVQLSPALNISEDLLFQGLEMLMQELKVTTT